MIFEGSRAKYEQVNNLMGIMVALQARGSGDKFRGQYTQSLTFPGPLLWF